MCLTVSLRVCVCLCPDRIWRPLFQQHMSLRSSRELRVAAQSRWVSWWKACSRREGGRSWRDRAEWSPASTLSTAAMLGASVPPPAAARGSDPALFLEPPGLSPDADRPGMVSVSSMAGTGGEEE